MLSLIYVLRSTEVLVSERRATEKGPGKGSCAFAVFHNAHVYRERRIDKVIARVARRKKRRAPLKSSKKRLVMLFLRFRRRQIAFLSYF